MLHEVLHVSAGLVLQVGGALEEGFRTSHAMVADVLAAPARGQPQHLLHQKFEQSSYSLSARDPWDKCLLRIDNAYMFLDELPVPPQLSHCISNWKPILDHKRSIVISSRHPCRPFAISLLSEDWPLRMEAAQACIQRGHYLGNRLVLGLGLRA